MLNYVISSKIKQAETTASVFPEVCNLENWLIIFKKTQTISKRKCTEQNRILTAEKVVEWIEPLLLKR